MKPTRDEILAEPAGPRMDVWVAEWVMEWKRETAIPGLRIDNSHRRTREGDMLWFAKNGDVFWSDNLPSWSTDIAAAWEVEEKIAERGLIDRYCQELNEIANVHWDNGVRQPQRWQLVHAVPDDRCRAALLTVLEGAG